MLKDLSELNIHKKIYQNIFFFNYTSYFVQYCKDKERQKVSQLRKMCLKKVLITFSLSYIYI